MQLLIQHCREKAKEAIESCVNLLAEEEYQDYHDNVGHMGQETVLASLRSKFWIVKERSAVRCNLRQCGSCKRRKAQPGEQFMGDLPSDRLTPENPPFSQVGVAFFGPFEVKQGRSIVKRYGCIFIAWRFVQFM